MTDTKARLAHIEKLTNAASKGPWRRQEIEEYQFVVSDRPTPICDGSLADCEFIAMARTEMPWLIEEVKRLAAENALQCAQCGSRTITTVVEHETFKWGNGPSALVVEVDVPVRRCQECSFAFTDDEGEAKRADALVRALGREVKELTERAEKAESELRATMDGAQMMARVAAFNKEEAEKQHARAEKAEAERDKWKAAHDFVCVDMNVQLSAARALSERRKAALKPLIDALGCEYPVVMCHHRYKGEPSCWSAENCEHMQGEAKAAHDAEEG